MSGAVGQFMEQDRVVVRHFGEQGPGWHVDGIGSGPVIGAGFTVLNGGAEGRQKV